jgi:hypothetical protein
MAFKSFGAVCYEFTLAKDLQSNQLCAGQTSKNASEDKKG